MEEKRKKNEPYGAPETVSEYEKARMVGNPGRPTTTAPGTENRDKRNSTDQHTIDFSELQTDTHVGGRQLSSALYSLSKAIGEKNRGGSWEVCKSFLETYLGAQRDRRLLNDADYFNTLGLWDEIRDLAETEATKH